MSRINNQDESSDESYESSEEMIGDQNPPRSFMSSTMIGDQNPPRSFMSSTSNRPRSSMISIGKIMKRYERETRRADTLIGFDKSLNNEIEATYLNDRRPNGMLRPSNQASNRLNTENPDDFHIMVKYFAIINFK